MSYFNSEIKINPRGKINWLIKVLPVANYLPDIFHIQWAKSLEEWIFLKEILAKPPKLIQKSKSENNNSSPTGTNGAP